MFPATAQASHCGTVRGAEIDYAFFVHGAFRARARFAKKCDWIEPETRRQEVPYFLKEIELILGKINESRKR